MTDANCPLRSALSNLGNLCNLWISLYGSALTSSYLSPAARLIPSQCKRKEKHNSRPEAKNPKCVDISQSSCLTNQRSINPAVSLTRGTRGIQTQDSQVRRQSLDRLHEGGLAWGNMAH